MLIIQCSTGKMVPKTAKSTIQKTENTLYFWKNIKELLTYCRGPKHCKSICDVKIKNEIGSAAVFASKCPECGFKFEWHTQPYFDQMPAGNMLLAAGAFFTATVPKKLIQLLESLNIAIFSYQTYGNIQRYIFFSCSYFLLGGRLKVNCHKCINFAYTLLIRC